MPALAHKASLSCGLLAKPHGAPRGLLIHYILHKIASKPSHGYEILQDIEDRTEGAWRPGAGATYPILKKLVQEGMIKADSSTREDARRVYHVTPRGIEQLKAAKQTLADYGHRWQDLRGLISELIDAEHMEKFLIEGSKGHFQFIQDIFKTNMKSLPPTELEYILKEYTLNLERQLEWARQVMEGMKTPQLKRATK
ncbi:MAG TPA: PadR family transcriptional regulator [Nitrososphaera sp.]